LDNLSKLEDEQAAQDRRERPYVVGEVANPGVIERFATTNEAVTYIEESFDPDDVADGRYYIDGPEDTQ
jgi:hypothetical protein